MSLPNRSVRLDPAHAEILNKMLGLLRAGRAEEVAAALEAIETPEQKPVGPFRSAQAAQDFLVGRMVFTAHPQAVWLFGSRARGDARPDSDFDLMVVLPDDDTIVEDVRRGQLADSVIGAGIGVDVAVCRAEDFAAYGQAAGSLIRTVHEQGREIYVSRAERKRRREEMP